MENIRKINTNLNAFKNIYFLGIGGIGMSALARYFKTLNWNVAGYDKTPTPLTDTLQNEGIEIHYEDKNSNIPAPYNQKQDTLIVLTPAIPKNMGELIHFQSKNFEIVKRSELLGLITQTTKGLGVAGTHGKTTTSTLLAHILNQSKEKCTAFLGGISSNYQTNLIVNPKSKYTVIEADEFDRSFLRLSPFASIITSVDPDHLDIYNDENTFKKGFEDYAKLHPKNGCLIQKYGLNLTTEANDFTYAIENNNANYNGYNLRYENEKFLMDVDFFNQTIYDLEIGIPGKHNAENALACFALCHQLGIEPNEIIKGIATFKGVKRRFEHHIKTQNLIYIDDYAHHPTELNALITAVKQMYPDRKITGIFQPHLFSRTRDFFDDFARQLAKLDEVILMPIYPAREEPIEGITSDALLQKIAHTQKNLFTPSEVLTYLKNKKEGVFLTIGAGDIDRIVNQLKEIWSE